MTLKPGDFEFQLGCCSNFEPYPFKCSECGHVMVYCVECSTLIPDLHHLDRDAPDFNATDASRPAFQCPWCAHSFEFYFPRNRAYRVTRDDLIRAGLRHFLVEE